MQEYIVFRHQGAEAVEGESPADHDRRPVVRLFATDASDACSRASTQVALETGQWLTAELADEVDAKVNEIGLRQEAVAEMENP